MCDAVDLSTHLGLQPVICLSLILDRATKNEWIKKVTRSRWIKQSLSLWEVLGFKGGRPRTDWRSIVNKDLLRMGITWQEAEVSALNRSRLASECDPMHPCGCGLNQGQGQDQGQS